MIILDQHEELCKWADIGIFGFSNGYDGKSKAIGYTKDGKLVSAVIYSNFKARQDGSFYDVEMGVYSVDKSWADRYYLKTVFNYPFTQLNLGRVTTVCSAEDEEVIMFNKRLGFTQEGTHRKAWFTGCDALSFSMLKEECKWI